MSKNADAFVVACGAFGTVEYAICANGSIPARKFVEELTVQEQAQMAALF